MKARNLALSTLLLLGATPAAAQPASAEPPLGLDALDVRLIGHGSVLDLVHLPDGSVATLGDAGFVILWRGNSALAWATFEGASDLALAEGVLAIASGQTLTLVSEDLSVLEEREVDGNIPCNGADALWAWNLDAHEAYALGPSVNATLALDEAPLGDATCTWSPQGLALAWDDGERARGVAQDGTTFEAEWNAQSAPRAVPGASGWEIETSPSAADYARACDGIADGVRQACAAPSALQTAPYLRPSVHPPSAAAILHDGVAIADRGGWTSVTIGEGDEPTVTRFTANVVGLDPTHHGTVFTCEKRGGELRLQALRPADAEPVDSVTVAACPLVTRPTTGRSTFRIGTESFAWDVDLDAFVPGAAVRPPHRLETRRAWSSACAGVASTVHMEGAHRVFGPVCGEAHLINVETPNGRTLGTAICRSSDGRPDAALAPNGTPLALPDGARCNLEVIIAPGEAASETLLAEDALRTLAATSRGVLLSGIGGVVEILTIGEGAVLLTESEFWVSPDLRERIVWSTDGVPHLVQNAATAEVWDSALLQRMFGREASPRLFRRKATTEP